MTPKINQTENTSINKELIDRIISGKVTLKDVEFLSEAFGQASEKTVRDALIQSLASNLPVDGLHALNKAIVENANIWVQKEDQYFMLREAKDSFFKNLLILEAQKTGFKVDSAENGKFSNEKGEFTGKITVSPEMLDHYATLKDGFYQQRNQQNVNQAIAESMSFILVRDVVRATAAYKAMGPKDVALLEKEFTDKGIFVKYLAQNNIINQVQHQNKPNSPPLSQKDIDKASLAIMANLKNVTKSAIIDKSLESLKRKGLSVSDQQQQKIRTLTESIEKIPANVLVTQSTEITNYLSKELKASRTFGSLIKSFFSGEKQYAIAANKITKIGQKLYDVFVKEPIAADPKESQQVAGISKATQVQPEALPKSPLLQKKLTEELALKFQERNFTSSENLPKESHANKITRNTPTNVLFSSSSPSDQKPKSTISR